jgi:hypothetical protein
LNGNVSHVAFHSVKHVSFCWNFKAPMCSTAYQSMTVKSLSLLLDVLATISKFHSLVQEVRMNDDAPANAVLVLKVDSPVALTIHSSGHFHGTNKSAYIKLHDMIDLGDY